MARKKAPEGPLGSFGGYPVTAMSVALRNAGDGFSESLAIAPNPHLTGDECYWVIKTVTGPIDHNPLTADGKKAKPADLILGFGSYMRVEDQIVIGAMEVTEDQVGTWMAENETRITQAKADREAAERRAKGEFSLADDNPAAFGAEGGGFDPAAEVPAEDV